MFDAIIIIQGEPRSQERHRDGKYGVKYDPSAKSKESFAVQCLAQWRPDGFPTTKNFAVDIAFHCGGQVKDCDNCQKFVLDALQGFFWSSDRQVKDCHVHVFDNSDNPRTVLMIKVLGE